MRLFQGKNVDELSILLVAKTNEKKRLESEIEDLEAQISPLEDEKDSLVGDVFTCLNDIEEIQAEICELDVNLRPPPARTDDNTLFQHMGSKLPC